MCCLQYGVAPEAGPEHRLEHPQHVPHRVLHPVVALLEEDDEDVDVAEIVLELIDHARHLAPLISGEEYQIRHLEQPHCKF